MICSASNRLRRCGARTLIRTGKCEAEIHGHQDRLCSRAVRLVATTASTSTQRTGFNETVAAHCRAYANVAQLCASLVFTETHASAPSATIYKEHNMSGTKDKIKGKYDQVAGKIKEETGDALDNDKMENEGKLQKAKGHLNESKGKVKDALTD